MRKKKLITLLFGAILATAGHAQSKNWQCRGQVAIGSLISGTEMGYTLQASYGLTNKRIYTGLNAGIDNYGIRHLPVTAFLEYYPWKSKGLYVYGQAGPSFPFAQKEWRETLWTGRKEYDLHTGFTGEAGAGYRIPRNGRKSCTVSAGYSYRNSSAIRFAPVQPIWSSAILPGNPYVEGKYNWQYNRIVFRIGFGF